MRKFPVSKDNWEINQICWEIIKFISDLFPKAIFLTRLQRIITSEPS